MKKEIQVPVTDNWPISFVADYFDIINKIGFTIDTYEDHMDKMGKDPKDTVIAIYYLLARNLVKYDDCLLSVLKDDQKQPHQKYFKKLRDFIKTAEKFKNHE